MFLPPTRITEKPSQVQAVGRASAFVGLTREQSRFTTTHTREYFRRRNGTTTPTSSTSPILPRALANDV
jgi:hypothetical protein